jgi:TonB family protein
MTALTSAMNARSATTLCRMADGTPPTVHPVTASSAAGWLYRHGDLAYSVAFCSTTSDTMIRRVSTLILVAAGLACCGLAGNAQAAAPEVRPSGCKQPSYPRSALRREEDGVVMLGFLIRTDGTVARSVILSSTGSPELDSAARDELSKCAWKPMGVDGQALEHWRFVAYTWSLDDDPGLTRAKREAGRGAKQGDAAAFYRLSVLLSQTAQNDADRQGALAVLRAAAERGHPHAQYQLGMRYEQGDGVPADRDEAMRWYKAAAKQDDVFALQRLKLGRLVEPVAG